MIYICVLSFINYTLVLGFNFPIIFVVIYFCSLANWIVFKFQPVIEIPLIYVDPILLIKSLYFHLLYGQFFVILYFQSLSGEAEDETFRDILGVNYPLFLCNVFFLFVLFSLTFAKFVFFIPMSIC